MSSAVPAFRSFDVAAAHFLACGSDLPARFSYDAALNLWRRRTVEGWEPTDLGSVVAAAVDVLQAALEAPDVPLEFRAVLAPADEVETLSAVQDWDAERTSWQASQRAAHDAREAQKAARRKALEAEVEAGTAPPTAWATLRTLEPTPFRPGRRPLISPRHRERLLRAVSRRGVTDAVILASGRPVFRYAPTGDAPVQVDPRAWLAAVPRVPGAVVKRADLWEAYLAAVPDHAQPLDRTRFQALAREVLGPAVRRHPGHFVYLDAALPAEVEDGALTGP